MEGSWSSADWLRLLRRTAGRRPRRPFRELGCVSLICASVTACERHDAVGSTGITVDTVGGVVVVHNAGPGLWRRGAEWTVREDFRIGSVLGDSSNSFTSRNLVAALSPAGDIYVIDYGADQIYSYTGSGQFKRVIGRAGSGPGEFDGPTGLAWDGAGRMWVADARNRRYTLFDDSGAVLSTFPREVTGLKRVPHSLYVDRAGLIVDELAAQGEFYYPRISMEGVTLDTVAMHPIPPISAAFAGKVVSRRMEAMRFVGNHYISRPRSVLAPDGTVWTAETGEPRLARLDSDGDTLRIVELAHRAGRGLSAKDEERIREGLAEIGMRPDEAEFTRPIIDQIHVLEDGHLLVGIVETVGEAATTFDVLDPDGRLLGSLRTGFGMPYRSVPTFTGDTLLAVTEGRLNVPYVVRATLVR